MSGPLHGSQRPLDGIHTPIAFNYANAADRIGASGFVADDLLKMAHQQDDDTIWILTSIDPTWVSVNTTGVIGSHASTHQSGSGDEISVFGLSGVLADKQDADKLQARNIDAAAPADGDALLWNSTASEWQPGPPVVAGDVFGKDYQTAISVARQTTTSTTYQVALSMVTPSFTGTYRIGWHAVVDQSAIGDAVESQLYNSTDAVVLGSPHQHEPKDNRNLIGVGGFLEVVFTGAAKTFQVQYRQQRGSIAGIQDIRIEIWRVS